MSATNSATKVVLVPQYMRNFACITTDCEDTCCAGWGISIDKNTYEKYTQLSDAQLLPLFQEFASPDPSSVDHFDYAKVNMKPDLSCPMLTDDKHCTIHRHLGADYLSNSCMLYPRMSNVINGILERSATLSCPEAARLALLNPDGIEFDEVEEPLAYNALIGQVVDTTDPARAHTSERYFWDLRIFTIGVLQNREYDINERLIILGLFYNKAQEMVTTNRTAEIPGLIELYSKAVQDGSLKASLNNIAANNELQMHLLRLVMTIREQHGFHHQRYLDCLHEFVQGIQYGEETPLPELSANYRQAYEQHFLVFFEEHSYLFENYLVNYVFKKAFPLGKRSLFDEYIVMVIHYAMIKMHLVGMAGYHQGMSTDQVIKLVQSFSKTTEHFTQFFDQILDVLKANDLASVAYLAILIKD